MCPRNKASIDAASSLIADNATGVSPSLLFPLKGRGGLFNSNNDLTRMDACLSAPTEASAFVGGITITLPWPPSALSPNTRHAHWSKLAKAKGRYRFACATVARSQGATKIAADKLLVRMTFVPPDKRLRDLDNLISSMKAGLDGLADVLGVDDNRWQLAAELLGGQIGGFVRVEVAPC